MYKDLSRRLKLARVAAGITQRELAKAADVSQSLITKIESGKSKRPQVEILCKLARILELPEKIFLEKDDASKFKDQVSLKELLVNSGINEEAAEIIVRSLRKNVRERLKSALK